MTPEAPRSAIPIITLVIIFLPSDAFPIEIMIPPTTIKTKEIIKMTVTNILVILHIKTGNAVVPETANSPSPLSVAEFSIQFPIKGIEVLSDMPQQTHVSEQGLHSLLTFLNHVGQTHIQKLFTCHQWGERQVVPAAIGQHHNHQPSHDTWLSFV